MPYVLCYCIVSLPEHNCNFQSHKNVKISKNIVAKQPARAVTPDNRRNHLLAKTFDRAKDNVVNTLDVPPVPAPTMESSRAIGQILK